MSIFSIALTLFLVANPIGNTPVFVSLVKDFEFERQKRILFREAIIALLIALFFQFFGELFLGLLHIQSYALSICGGTMLFLTALKMIFPGVESKNPGALQQEPLIVPIAAPLISGPGLLSMIMLFTYQEENNLMVTGAILMAWIGVTLVLTLSPYLLKIFGKKGLLALEQLMGMILSLIAASMFIKGLGLFMQVLGYAHS